MPATRQNEIFDPSLWSPVDSYLVDEEARDLEFWLQVDNAAKFLDILWTHSTPALPDARPRGYALSALLEALSEARIDGAGGCWRIQAHTLFNAGIRVSLTLDRERAEKGLKIFGSGPPPGFCKNVAACYSSGLTEQLVFEALAYYRKALSMAASMDAKYLLGMCFIE